MFKAFFKLLTLPIWIVVWVFKARAVVRSGRRVYPVAPVPRTVIRYRDLTPQPSRNSLPRETARTYTAVPEAWEHLTPEQQEQWAMEFLRRIIPPQLPPPP